MPKRNREFVLETNKAVARLYNEDCLEGMKNRLLPRSVDIVVTSPPYNLGVDYSDYDDTIPREQYLFWLESWAEIVSGVLKDNGSLFLNVGSKPTDPTVPFQVLERSRKYFCLQNVIHWIKSISIDKEDAGESSSIKADISVGHYKPINSSRFLNDCHEYIFHLTKSANVPLDRLAIGVPYQDKSNVSRWRSSRRDLHCRGNAWFIPYETIQDRETERPHPATFPVKLAEMCIKLHGVVNTDLVLDPFMGIGASAIAAASLGVNFIGFETDPDYFKEATRKIRARIRV